jgi:hypothetical protein
LQLLSKSAIFRLCRAESDIGTATVDGAEVVWDMRFKMAQEGEREIREIIG